MSFSDAAAPFFIITIISIFVIVYWWYAAPFRSGFRKQHIGDLADAESDYTAMLRRNPRYWQAWYNRAMIHALNHNFEDALADLNQVILIKPNLPRAYNLRGAAHFALKHFDRAAENYQKALSQRTKPKEAAAANLGLAILKLGEYERYKPTSNPARNLLLDQALAYFEEVLRHDPENDYAFSGKAQIYKRKGDFQTALSTYDEGFRRLPYSPVLLTNRSTLYMAQGNLDAALADNDKVIYLNPKLPISYSNRACVYILQNELDKALADCEQALALDPEMIHAFNNRGTTYFLMDRQEDALNDFQHALALDSMNEYAHVGTAITLHRVGRLEEAKAQWKRLIELDAEYRDADYLQKDNPIAPALIKEARKVAALLEQ